MEKVYQQINEIRRCLQARSFPDLVVEMIVKYYYFLRIPVTWKPNYNLFKSIGGKRYQIYFFPKKIQIISFGIFGKEITETIIPSKGYRCLYPCQIELDPSALIMLRIPYLLLTFMVIAENKKAISYNILHTGCNNLPDET